MKEIIDNLELKKIKNFCSLQKTTSRGLEDKSQTERKHFQMTHLIKNSYPKHKNFQNSTVRKQLN